MVLHSKPLSLAFFIIIAASKLVLEFLIRKNTGQKNKKITQKLSFYFIITGLVTPCMIFCETLISGFEFPVYLAIIFFVIQLSLLALRQIAVQNLGNRYSVDIIVKDQESFIKKGIYRIFRHPIYLISILENIFYPLASSAVFSAIILSLFYTPFILLRRNMEDKILIEKYGDEYMRYRNKTIF